LLLETTGIWAWKQKICSKSRDVICPFFSLSVLKISPPLSDPLYSFRPHSGLLLKLAMQESFAPSHFWKGAPAPTPIWICRPPSEDTMVCVQ
jgi:hypothetical protein